VQSQEHNKDTTICLLEFGFTKKHVSVEKSTKARVSLNTLLTQVITKIELAFPSLFSIERPKSSQGASHVEGSC
jgi:hypothetical protein